MGTSISGSLRSKSDTLKTNHVHQVMPHPLPPAPFPRMSGLKRKETWSFCLGAALLSDILEISGHSYTCPIWRGSSQCGQTNRQTVQHVLIVYPQLGHRPRVARGSEACFYLLTFRKRGQGGLGSSELPGTSSSLLPIPVVPPQHLQPSNDILGNPSPQRWSW